MPLTHLTEHGHTHMVDVSAKQTTRRTAIAEASVFFPPEVYAQIQAAHGQTAKGTITEIARIAGIMAAKNTAAIIPLCHPMMLERCQIHMAYQNHSHSLHIRAEVAVTHKTGVEMEALTAATAAALTVYDMTKALSHDIIISNVQLVHKSGGKSDFNRLPSRSDYVYRSSMITPPLGIYRHYKGNLYQLLHIACHSETEEPLAVYRALYGDYGVWVRPLAMFTENVVTEQGSVARFALVKAVD